MQLCVPAAWKQTAHQSSGELQRSACVQRSVTRSAGRSLSWRKQSICLRLMGTAETRCSAGDAPPAAPLPPPLFCPPQVRLCLLMLLSLGSHCFIAAFCEEGPPSQLSLSPPLVSPLCIFAHCCLPCQCLPPRLRCLFWRRLPRSNVSTAPKQKCLRSKSEEGDSAFICCWGVSEGGGFKRGSKTNCCVHFHILDTQRSQLHQSCTNVSTVFDSESVRTIVSV